MQHPLQSEIALEEYQGLVDQIRTHHPQSQQLLFSAFGRGLRFLARQDCSGHVGDCISETLYEVTKGIRLGELTSPNSLPAYIRSTYRRVCASWEEGLPGMVDRRGTWDIVALDGQLIYENRILAMTAALRRLDQEEKDLLGRLYVSGQTREEVCHATGLKLHQLRKVMASIATRVGRPAPPSKIV